MTTAEQIVARFVQVYAFGLSPALDELWLHAAAWQREAPPIPRGEDSQPYPRHGA